jgi:hypothetical protein
MQALSQFPHHFLTVLKFGLERDTAKSCLISANSEPISTPLYYSSEVWVGRGYSKDLPDFGMQALSQFPHHFLTVLKFGLERDTAKICLISANSEPISTPLFYCFEVWVGTG